MKHKARFIEDAHLDPKLAWLKAQLESDAMPDPLALPAKVHSHLYEVVVRFMGRFKIPTGYEDEAGFHFGEPPGE